MFEKFTERAKMILFYAAHEAFQLGSLCIETEHILLGLLRVDNNLAKRFSSKAISVDAVRKEIKGRSMTVESATTSSFETPFFQLPFSDEAKKVLNFADEEAETLSCAYLGTDHILVALLREERSLASQLLREKGLCMSVVRQELARSASEKKVSGEAEEPPHTSESGGVLTTHVDLSDWRRRIDEVDLHIVHLLNERSRYVIQIGKIKRAVGAQIYDPEREAEIISNVQRSNRGPLDDNALKRLFERILDESRRVERIASDAPPPGNKK